MNIAFIQPFTDNLEPPISLAYLAGSLAKVGHFARIIDMQIPEIRERWEDLFLSEQTDIVGITMSTPQVKESHRIARRIKEFFPHMKVIVGGAHPSVLPERTLDEFPDFDVVVVGEGDETIVELVNVLGEEGSGDMSSVPGIAYRKDDVVVRTPSRNRIADLDVLPNPHEHYDFDYYLRNKGFAFKDRCVSMFTSRGCPYTCRFCATKGIWTRKYVCRSTDAVLDETRYVLGRGARAIVFRDSTFIVDKQWVRELCDKILYEKLRFAWAVNSRIDHVDRELFAHMRKAGLHTVYFGVESGSQKMLDFYGKGITVEQTESAFRICRKIGIHTGAYIMVGALPESREDLDRTYRFVQDLKPDFVAVFIFMPLPGSELHQYYVERGFHFEYDHIRGDKSVFQSAGMTIDEMEALRKRWFEELNPVPNVLQRTIQFFQRCDSLEDFCTKVSRKVLPHHM